MTQGNEQLTISGDTGDVPLEEEAPKPFEYDEEEPNLVDAFMSHTDGQEALKDISSKVRKDFEEAWSSTEEYRARKAKDWLIFTGNLPPKEFPFKNAANCHVPIMIENTTRNVFRAFAELFGDWDNVFGVAAIGPNDENMAQVLTLHGNWQLREQIPDFKRQQMKGMLGFFSVGDVTCHSFWDPVRMQNRHEMLSCDEFVVPYTYTSMMPDYSDVPYRVKKFPLYPHEIEARRETWSDVDRILDGPKPTFESDEGMPGAEAAAKDEGVEPSEVESAAPYQILWYEGWLELPNQDGRRFCRVMCDKDSDKVFELAIHEHPDWQDVQRHETEQQQLADFRNHTQAFQSMLTEQGLQMQQLEQSIAYARDTGMDASQAEQQLMQAKQMQAQVVPPAPPTWMKDPQDPTEQPRPVKKVPIHLFAHGVCIEPLFGNLGLGYGRMQADFNRAANTALSQFADSATLANVWSMIVADGIEFPGGNDISIEPGKLIRISGSIGDDIRKSIIELKPGPANPQLVELVKEMREFGQTSMQSPSVLSGDPGKSGETFRGIAARIEQATKQLSVSTRKYGDFLEQILKNNALLNSVYLRDEEFFHIALQSGSPFWGQTTSGEAPPPQPAGQQQSPMLGQFAIGRKMYERNYHVEIRSDLRFVTQSQKIQEADELVTMGLKIPMLAQNPIYQYHAVRKALMARGQNEMVAALGPPPTPQTMQQPGMPQPGAPPPGMPQQPHPPQQPPQQPPHPQPPPQQNGQPPQGVPGPRPVAA